MAAATGTRQYTAIFAIGAKMLASFKGVMNAASARLTKLRTQTLAFGKSILKLTGVIGLLGTAVAGLGVGELLRSLFTGATDQAKEARQRINSTIASFLQLRDIAKAGDPWKKAQDQLDIIYKQNEALGKQGVLHTDIYNEMTKQLAQGGVPPRQIKAAVGALGDLLVKTRGVNASEQEAAELAEAYVKAIHGKTKGMQAFGVFISPDKVDSQGRKIKKSFQEIYEQILRIMSAKGIAGFNKRLAETPEGKIQIFRNRLQDMREEIGNRILPAQARMAEMWLQILTPENQKLLFNAVDWFMNKLKDLVEYLKTKVIPWFKSKEGQKFFKQLGDAAVWVVQHWKQIAIVIAAIVAGMWLLQAATVAVNLAVAAIAMPEVTAILALAAAVLLIATNWDTVKAAVQGYVASIRAIPEDQQTGWQKFFNWWYTEWGNIIDDFKETGLWKEIASIDWGKVFGKLSKWWDDTIAQLYKNWTDFTDWFKKFDWTFGFAKQWRDAIDEWKRYWGEIKDTIMHPSKWFGRGGGAPGAAGGGAAAAAAVTAPAQAAAAQMPLTPAGVKAVQDERAEIMAEMRRPELRNLISATLATEAHGAEDQKNVLESLTNRLVAQKAAGTYKGVEAAIKGGFYGPYKRGETQAVMAKGLSDARYQQVGQYIDEIAAGRNALGGLTDQGMANEIKGAIKEQHGEDYYGLQGAPGEKETAAYRASRGYQMGGIAKTPQIATLAERGPEAVLPMGDLSKFFEGADAITPSVSAAAKMIHDAYDKAADITASGGGLLGGIQNILGVEGMAPARTVGHTTHLNFTPNITINGNASEAEQVALEAKLRNLAREFIENFKRAQYQERRLSYESGYG